jgi:hypothetical protein
MASHWPPRKMTPERESNQRLLAVRRGDQLLSGRRLVQRKLDRGRRQLRDTILRQEQSGGQINLFNLPRLYAFFGVGPSKNRRPVTGRLQILGLAKTSAGFRLTRLWPGPIIGPVLAALSLPAGGHLIPPDGRGTRWSPVIGASSSGCRAIGSEGRDPAPTAG